MKQFVTGANGFVGAALCRKLAERGDDVWGLVRKTSDLSLLENIDIRTVVGSLEALDRFAGTLRGVDTVFHIAGAVSDWGTLSYFRKINVEGTSGMLEAAIEHGVRRFVYVSSAAVHTFIGARDMENRQDRMCHYQARRCIWARRQGQSSKNGPSSGEGKSWIYRRWAVPGCFHLCRESCGWSDTGRDETRSSRRDLCHHGWECAYMA
jgi:thioester reductase-like protein